MQLNKLFLIIIGSIILCGCDSNPPDDASSKKYEPIDVDTIQLHPSLQQVLNGSSSSIVPNDDLGAIGDTTVNENLTNGYLIIPEEFRMCMGIASSPKSIKDLKAGLTVDAYKFDKNSQAKLGFLGFGNIEIEDKETIIVVEYKQTGTQNCNNFQLFYGVGARLLMHIKDAKRSAKVNTPQQISASVTFGRADVLFSIKTFGITGPGVSRLVKSGTMTENTYTEFLNEISNLIVDAYSDSSKFIIDPQPLFLKQQ